ncbi:hypothetical protein [Cryptosporangium sp. NPDC051539]|uniref:hypothetical protein n=1 Tax=Cryptosporangium sp. NPDC051539 TaxID=3363962 RepID=UPI003795E96F
MDDVATRLRDAWSSGQELRLFPDDELDAAVLLELLRAPGGHPRGMHLRGARIAGALDWSWQVLKVPLVLHECVLADEWDLNYATLPNLVLHTCRTDRIDLADAIIAHDLIAIDTAVTELSLSGSRVAGDVVLRDGFASDGEIRMSGATLGGDLVLSGATLRNPGGVALSAERAQVTGSVVLNEGFTADGEIRMLGTTVGGSLEVNGASLANPDGNAFSADGARVAGSVYFTDGFAARGEVRLLGATIGGVLSLNGASLTNPGADAFSADGAQITGDVFLSGGFTAAGEIRLLGATIGGILTLNGATLTNPGADVLSVDGAHVTGNVFLDDGFTAVGGVQVLGATFGGDLDLYGATLGAVSLEGTRVAGCLRLQSPGARPDGIFDLTRAHVGELRDAPGFWPAPGRLILTGFTYDRLGTHTTVDVAERLDWIRRNQRYSPQPYRQLARVLTDTGHPDRARRILIAARDDQRRRGDLRWYQRIANWLLGATIAHGYRPLRPAWILAVAAVLTWWIVAMHTAVFVPTGDNVPEDPRTGRPTVSSERCTGDYPCLIPAAYALENMVPILDLHQASLWQPTTATPTGKAVRGWLYATSIVGWIGSTLIVVALTGLADRRD